MSLKQIMKHQPVYQYLQTELMRKFMRHRDENNLPAEGYYSMKKMPVEKDGNWLFWTRRKSWSRGYQVRVGPGWLPTTTNFLLYMCGKNGQIDHQSQIKRPPNRGRLAPLPRSKVTPPCPRTITWPPSFCHFFMSFYGYDWLMLNCSIFFLIMSNNLIKMTKIRSILRPVHPRCKQEKQSVKGRCNT